ncbi:MAG: hypothetical protein ACE5KE_15290 [Methanosarcinales archaeon]
MKYLNLQNMVCVLDTSTILRSHLIKERTSLDIMSFIQNAFIDLKILSTVQDELINQNFDLNKLQLTVVPKTKSSKHVLRTMKVHGFKNLGEADSVSYCIPNEDTVFLTDDISACVNARKLIQYRSQFFIAFLVTNGVDYFTKQDMTQILEERHSIRKLKKKIYKTLNDRINDLY